MAFRVSMGKSLKILFISLEKYTSVSVQKYTMLDGMSSPEEGHAPPLGLRVGALGIFFIFFFISYSFRSFPLSV